MTIKQCYWKNKLSITSAKSTKHEKTFDDFRRINIIKSWADELAQFKANKNIPHWSLIGHGILYLMNNPEEGETLSSLVAKHAKFNFVSVPKYEVKDALKNLIPKSIAPCIVYLEPGDWMVPTDTNKPEDELEKFQAELQEKIIGIDPNFPIIFTTTITKVDSIAKTFRRLGVFDRLFEMGEDSLEEKGHDFVQQIGFDLCDKSITEQLGKVGRLVDYQYDKPRDRGIVSIALKRIHKKLGRKLSFFDLINTSTNGDGECDAAAVSSKRHLETVATHEAGHVVAAIIDSAGTNIPEYASAFPGPNFTGVVVDSYSYMQDYLYNMSYRDYEHKIRVCLAGRIAEHLILGIDNITVNVAYKDLEGATNMCRNMFGFCGISSDMKNPNTISNNLAVVIDRSSTSEDAHIEQLCREYLKKQYDHVMNLFKLHRHLLVSVIDQLRSQRVLNQQELESIYRSYLNHKIDIAA